MTRLIPEDINKELKKEYRFRFFTLLSFALSIVILASLVFVSSSYLLLYLYEKAYVTNNLNSNNESALLHEQLVKKIEELHALSLKVQNFDSKNNLNSIESLFTNAAMGISIQALEMTNSSQITLRGVADTRENLLAFQNTMKQNPVFKDFSIPIESLARQKDVSFNVTFTYYEN